jgi:hypothetical protein
MTRVNVYVDEVAEGDGWGLGDSNDIITSI